MKKTIIINKVYERPTIINAFTDLMDMHYISDNVFHGVRGLSVFRLEDHSLHFVFETKEEEIANFFLGYVKSQLPHLKRFNEAVLAP